MWGKEEWSDRSTDESVGLDLHDHVTMEDGEQVQEGSQGAKGALVDLVNDKITGVMVLNPHRIAMGA